MSKVITIFEDVSIKEIPYVGQDEFSFYEKIINKDASVEDIIKHDPYFSKNSVPIKKLIEQHVDAQTVKYNKSSFIKFDTYYYAYSPNVEKLLKMYFCEFNVITDKLYSDLYKQQVKTEYLKSRIEKVKSVSFWQRLKFLFNPKSLKV